eukprot:TRINITY_DN2369_c0_g1_i5.p2 TRINITY_DN2369_c0_g1~~TRINITY_DN2369_c0_g1_i5.p2  ORF type:complete len:238 (+),score=27.12 TRINITY_DN2369_c0_g1_i5:89-802(+)
MEEDLLLSVLIYISFTLEFGLKILMLQFFSIDYSLAPNSKYPVQLEECWQCYQWILKYCKNYLRISFKKLIIIGDSAGGNLALSLTFLAITFGISKPDGLILAYPALSFDENKFSPSWLYYGLRNELIPYSIIQLMLGAYIPQNLDASKDFFLSSLLTNDELLKLLPPIDIICGDRDPLQDDCWRFYQKLLKLEKTVTLTFYKNIPHAFLNYSVPNAVKITPYLIKELSKCILKMIN